ncbi:MAG: peptide deformylase [Candidatus Omnitrophota bacterium]
MKSGKCNGERPLSVMPAQVLRAGTRRVKSVDDRIRDICAEMERTMRSNRGIGLAAPQVGLDIKVAVIDTGDGPIRMINPVILKKEGADVMDEGCLSVPDTLVRVKRAAKVTVRYTDDAGVSVEKTFTGIKAKAIQHEIDHLEGRLIIDYLPWYRRLRVIRMFAGKG